jgi:hypothetical protein
VCKYALFAALIAAVVGLIVWAIKRPHGIVGRRNGHITYGYLIEWPVSFITVVVSALALLLATQSAWFGCMESTDRETLGSAGTYLLLTIGALAFSKARERRSIRMLCLAPAALGLCLACAFKFSC